MAYFPPTSSLFAQRLISAIKINDDMCFIPKKDFLALLYMSLSSAELDMEKFLQQNPDLAETFEDVDTNKILMHFIAQGMAEGRSLTLKCNESEYMELNPDIKRAFNNGDLHLSDLSDHYLHRGYEEGRAGTLNQSVALNAIANILEE